MTRAIQVIRALILLLGLLACVQPAVAVESVTYLHNDAAGSPVAATDAAGNVIWREGYRAYGERTRNETAARSNRQFFHGKAFDADSGLAYFGARYYDPVVGRFMAIDPAGFDEANLHSVNRYAYGNNNPYSYTDPDGRAAMFIPYVVAAVRAGAQRLLTFALTRGAHASVTGAEIAAGEALGGASLAGGAAAAGARAAGEVGEAAAKGGVTEGTTVFRVWGEKSGPWGESWTTVNPNTVSNFRSAAGLPDVNTGRFVSEGILKSTEGVTSRGALVIKQGQQGGLPEVVIKNAEGKIDLRRVSGANPEF